MASFNKVILLGNLTRDPELRYTPKGMAVARLGLAVNRNYKTDTGESKEEVTFIDIDAWGKQAELISQYLRRGSPLFLEGRLKFDQWDDKNTGQKVNKLRVVLESFQFIGSPRSSEGGGPPPSGAPSASSPSSPSASASSAPPSRGAKPPGSPNADGGETAAGEMDDVPF